jgi:hypothetical protein
MNHILASILLIKVSENNGSISITKKYPLPITYTPPPASVLLRPVIGLEKYRRPSFVYRENLLLHKEALCRVFSLITAAKWSRFVYSIP